MSTLINKPALLNIDPQNGKFAIPLSFDFSLDLSAPISPPIPGIGGIVANGNSYLFDLSSIKSNIVIPPIKSVIGTLKGLAPQTVGPIFQGAMYIVCPLTQQVLAVDYLSSLANSPTDDQAVSFCLPLIAPGNSQIQIIKGVQSNGLMTGSAQLLLCTFDIPPFIR